MTHTTSRRAALAGLATLPAITTAALSAAADPIFAAIEAHIAACDALETIDQRVDPAAYAKAEFEIIRTADALFATPPRTVEGAKALVDFVLEDVGLSDADHWAVRALASLAEALPQLVGRRRT